METPDTISARSQYRIDQLREAVEHLKTVPQTGYTGLMAETHYKDEVVNLGPLPMLQLKDILGKSPEEVWDLFDQRVDEFVNASETSAEIKFKIGPIAITLRKCFRQNRLIQVIDPYSIRRSSY